MYKHKRHKWPIDRPNETNLSIGHDSPGMCIQPKCAYSTFGHPPIRNVTTTVPETVLVKCTQMDNPVSLLAIAAAIAVAAATQRRNEI